MQVFSDGSKIARVYCEVPFAAILQYKYIDEDGSYWDREEHRYLWTEYTEKECKFRVATEFSIMIDISEDRPFNEYIEMPEEKDVGEEELLEMISRESK